MLAKRSSDRPKQRGCRAWHCNITHNVCCAENQKRHRILSLPPPRAPLVPLSLVPPTAFSLRFAAGALEYFITVDTRDDSGSQSVNAAAARLPPFQQPRAPPSPLAPASRRALARTSRRALPAAPAMLPITSGSQRAPSAARAVPRHLSPRTVSSHQLLTGNSSTHGDLRL